jgi:S1-C subfamily serine protease
VVGVNDQEVDGIDALHRALSRVAPGGQLQLTVVRRTQRVSLALTAREPP